MANKDKYVSHNYWQRFSGLKQSYLDSQYVNKHPKGWIPDEAVNAYAGGAYIRGVSPILIAPDTPPLGRYLVGISAVVFNNENEFTLFFALGSLGMLYMLGTQIFSRKIFSLIVPLFISFEPLFDNQLVYTPLLDIMQLFFLLCAFYFFNLGTIFIRRNWGYFILACIFLGFFIATKFYITGITIAGSWIVTLLIFRKIKPAFKLIIILPLSIIILLLSYIRVLFDHYTINKFLGIQKYVFLYHKSQLIYPFSVWALLLFNKWYVWFGNKPVIFDAQWRITWPLTTIGTFATGVLMLARRIKISLPVVSLIIWVILYLLLFSAGQITTRYFIILLPVLYIVTIYVVEQLCIIYKK